MIYEQDYCAVKLNYAVLQAKQISLKNRIKQNTACAYTC